MPNDLTIKPVQAKRSSDDPPKTREPNHADATPAAKPSRSYVNPTLRLDAALGLVVIEFRDDSGKLTASIPSQRQIEAYRSHQEPRTDTERLEASPPRAERGRG